jgi:hypothetical protein
MCDPEFICLSVEYSGGSVVAFVVGDNTFHIKIMTDLCGYGLERVQLPFIDS